MAAAALGLGAFLRSIAHAFRFSRRSDSSEYMLYLKLVILGLGVVGGIGFLIKFVSSLIQLSR